MQLLLLCLCKPRGQRQVCPLVEAAQEKDPKWFDFGLPDVCSRKKKIIMLIMLVFLCVCVK